MRQKQLYEAPETEVLELRLEGSVLLNVSNTENASGQGIDWYETE